MSTSHQPYRPHFPILLVEDDLAIIDILQRSAKICFPEADLIPINTFEEAVLYLYNMEGRGPRLVLLDINLPGTRTGIDFLKLLREHPLGKLLPAIILSASDNIRHIRSAYQHGASSYFVKPFTYQEWKSFMLNLRQYWFETAALPQTYFEKQKEGSL